MGETQRETGNKNNLNIYQRINFIHKEVTTIIKDAEIVTKTNSYEVVTHDAVTALLHKPMASVGIVPVPTVEHCHINSFEVENEYNGKITKKTNYQATLKINVKFVNHDNPEDCFISSIYSYAFDTGDKAIGKAYSMGIKNIYLKVFMLESQDAEEARTTEEAEYKPLTHGEAKSIVSKDLGETEITFGKFKGKSFKELKAGELTSWLMWMKNESEKSNKKPSPIVEKGFKYLELIKNQGNAIPF